MPTRAQPLLRQCTDAHALLLRVHFGLGSAARADRLEVRWPSGRVDVLRNVAANRIVTIREGEGMVDAVALAR